MAKDKQEDQGSDYREKLLEGQDVAAGAEQDAGANPPAEPESTQNPAAESPPDQGPEQPAGETGAEPAEPTFLEQVADLGFEGVESEEDARARVLEAYRQTQTEQETLREEVERLKQFNEFYLAEKRKAEQQPEPESQTDQAWWRPPDFDTSRLEKYREYDAESGQWNWKPDTPPEFKMAAGSYQDYLDNWAIGISTRPHETLPPAVFGILKEHPDKAKEALAPLFDEWYQAKRAEEDERSFIDKLKNENADWIFETDPRTRQPSNRLSAAGTQMMRLVDEAAAKGIAKPQDQWEYAQALYRLQALESETGEKTASETASQAAEKKRRQHMRRAVSNPQRGGSAGRETEDAPPKNSNLSPGQQLLEQMERDGVGVP